MYFGRPEVGGIDADISIPLETNQAEGQLGKLSNGVLFSGRQDKVHWRGLLKHHPHRLHVIRGVPPVPFGIEISQVDSSLATGDNACNGSGDLARYECLAPARLFVIEQNSVRGEHPVSLAVIDDNPVCECL